MNSKGKGSGLALVIILIVALLIAFFVLKNMSSLGFGRDATTQQENVVQQAQDLVDQINDRMQQTGQKP